MAAGHQIAQPPAATRPHPAPARQCHLRLRPQQLALACFVTNNRYGVLLGMATKEDIITLPNPHLRQRSKKVGLITPEIKQAIQDMEAATLDWEDSREHEVA